MSFPFGTKVYLYNKELINIEDLKVGDRVLSFKNKNNVLMNQSELYAYHKTKDSNEYVVPMNKNDLELSYAYVYSIFINRLDKNLISLNGNELSKNTVILNAKNIKRFSDNDIYLHSPYGILERINDGDKYFMQKLNLDEDVDSIFNEDELISYNLDVSSKPSASIILNGNNFYCTENFVVLGSIATHGEEL